MIVFPFRSLHKRTPLSHQNVKLIIWSLALHLLIFNAWCATWIYCIAVEVHKFTRFMDGVWRSTRCVCDLGAFITHSRYLNERFSIKTLDNCWLLYGRFSMMRHCLRLMNGILLRLEHNANGIFLLFTQRVFSEEIHFDSLKCVEMFLMWFLCVYYGGNFIASEKKLWNCSRRFGWF